MFRSYDQLQAEIYTLEINMTDLVLHAIVNSTTVTASTVARNLSPLSTKLTNMLKTTDLLSVVIVTNF
jgi:hypothetical protein